MASIINVDNIRAVGSSTTGITINSTGNVLLPNRPSFMFTYSGANWTSNGGLSGSYSSTKVNEGSPAITWTDGTGRLTVPLTGLYLVTFGILVNPNGRLEGYLQHNDVSAGSASTVVNFNGTGSTYDGPTFTVVYPAEANDYFMVHRSSGTAYADVHANNYFGATFLG